MQIAVTRDQLDQAADQLHDDIEIRTNYSGRGMYDAQCVGVVVSSLSLAVEFTVALARVLAETDGDHADIDAVQERVADIADRMATDSMGYDMIAYWPNMTLTD